MDDKNGTLGKKREDLRESQVAAIKSAVLETLHKLEDLEKEKQIIHGAIKILKHDLFDLKDGRLDRIVERHEIDERSKELSAVCIERIKDQKPSAPWFILYGLKGKADKGSTDVNNSITKTHASGSYKLSDGSIKYL